MLVIFYWIWGKYSMIVVYGKKDGLNLSGRIYFFPE